MLEYPQKLEFSPMATHKKSTVKVSAPSKSKSSSGKSAEIAKKPGMAVKTTAIFKKPTHLGGLGRGLDALIGREATQQVSEVSAHTPVKPEMAPGTKSVFMVSLSMIHASPWQPRRVFDDVALQELADSIRAHGIIQPLICRASPAGGYELIGGERRMRAATEIGLKEVPIIVMEAADRDAAEMALVENLQREDLNIVEEAEGYRALADGFGMTQVEIAERVGKARASVANTMRLLELPDEVKQLLGSGLLSVGHAKVILGVEGEVDRIKLARDSVKDGLTVRMLEQRVERRKAEPRTKLITSDIPEEYVLMLLDKLHQRFGTSVRLSPSVRFQNGRRGRGKIEIDFIDNEDLSRLLDLLGVDVNEI